MHLNFNRHIPEEELTGLIMGPGMDGLRYYVQAVYHIEDKTRCDLRVLMPEETRITRDEMGQYRVMF